MAEIEAEMKVMEWPALPWSEWADTANTLHMWTQIVGKTRLALTPLQNHWWNVPLYVTARGLGTSAMTCGEMCWILSSILLRMCFICGWDRVGELTMQATGADGGGFLSRVYGVPEDAGG